MTKNVLLLIINFAFFSCSLFGQGKTPVVWTGTIVDLRTGLPLENVEVHGGGSGRVDLTEGATTGTDGRFAVVYDDALDLSFWKFYRLNAVAPADQGYFTHVSIYPNAGDVLVSLLPRNAFILGTVIDKASGAPIENATVTIGLPGRSVDSVKSDSEGAFAFEIAAFEGGVGANYEIGIPPENQLPHDEDDLITPIENYWLEIVAEGYERILTSDTGPAISLLSSISSETHTRVDLQLVPVNSTEAPIVTAEVNDPSEYLRWLAGHFSENELENQELTAPEADPDADGLSNEVEFELGSIPNNDDSDGDKMLDGWEHSNDTLILTVDAQEDRDGDGFPNLLEYQFGSVANDASSTPSVETSIHRAVRLDVPTVPGIRYRIEKGETVNGPFADAGIELLGDGETHRFYFDAESSQEVFRTLIVLP